MSKIKVAFFLILSMLLVSNKIFASAEKGNSSQNHQLFNWLGLENSASKHYSHKAYDFLAETAVNGCNRHYSDYIVNFANFTNQAGQFHYFSLPAITRYVYQFKKCLSAENLESLKVSISKGPNNEGNNFFGHGTLNHASAQATSWYLLTQLFPNIEVLDSRREEKYLSSEVQAELFQKLTQRFTKYSKQAHYELASPNYVALNFAPLLNIIDFASDQTLVDLAKGEANKTIQYLSSHSFHGSLTPPLTRQKSTEINETINHYDKEAIQLLGLDRQIIWYYLDSPFELEKEDFRSHKSPLWAVLYYLSDYSPELEPPSYNKDTVNEYVLEGWSAWGEDSSESLFGRVFIGENYSIGSAGTLFKPYWANDNVVEFGIKVKTKKLFNQIDCMQPYMNKDYFHEESNKFKDEYFRFHYDRSSPFMQSFLVDKNNLVIINNIPQSDPFNSEDYPNRFVSSRNDSLKVPQLIKCRIPNKFDEFKLNPEYLQVREGDTYLWIRSFNQKIKYSNDKNYLYLTIKGEKSGLHFYIDDTSKSFNELRQHALENKVSYRQDNNEIFFRNSDLSLRLYYNLEKVEGSGDRDRDISFISRPIIQR